MIGIEKEARIKANGLYITVRKDEDLLEEGMPPYSGSDGKLYYRDELEFSLEE